MYSFNEPVKQHIGADARAEGQIKNLPHWTRIVQVNYLLQMGLTVIKYDNGEYVCLPTQKE